MKNCGFWFFVAVVLVVSPRLSLAAGDSRLEEAIQQLLEVGWQPSYAARGAADNRFETIRQFAPDDANARYAYALVLIKQRRYSEAAKLLAQQIESGAENAHALKAKAWLSLLMKQYAAALAEIDRFSQVATKDASNARFLGTMFGYLEGPVSGQISDATLRDYREKTLARFDEDAQTSFEAARREVVEQFNSMTAEKSDIEEEAQAQAEKERKLLREDLEKQAERMAERRKELQPIRNKLLEEMQSEVAEIEKDLRPLAAEYARLESQAVVPRRELFFLSGEITRLRSRAEREKDPLLRDSLFREANRLSILALRYEADLAALERRAAAINAERARLVQQSQAVQARYKTQIDQLTAELGQLTEQQRRNELDQQRGLRPAQGDRRQSRAIAAQARALTTYLEFPLEAEKQRLRELLDTK